MRFFRQSSAQEGANAAHGCLQFSSDISKIFNFLLIFLISSILFNFVQFSCAISDKVSRKKRRTPRMVAFPLTMEHTLLRADERDRVRATGHAEILTQVNSPPEHVKPHQ
jgi:hypothetical protein